MSSRVIPKEELTAYQRWELSGLGEADGMKKPVATEAQPMALPTAEQLESIHQQAWQEGYKMGEEAGHKAGMEASRKAGAEHARRLAQLAQALDAELIRQDQEIAREVLGLALAVAKQMVRSALRVNDQLVLESIREALNSLPSLSGHLRVTLNPDDAEMVRDFMAAEHSYLSVKIVGDARLERGGFRLESSHSEVDGQLPGRWKEIVDCLGVDVAWLGD